MATLMGARDVRTSRQAELELTNNTRKNAGYVSMASTSKKVVTSGTKYVVNFAEMILNLYLTLILQIVQWSMSLSLNGRKVTKRNENLHKPAREHGC